MVRSGILFVSGVLLGIVLVLSFHSVCNWGTAAKANELTQQKLRSKLLKYPIKATLYRFNLNKKNMKIYQEWVQWYHDEYGPMIKTLERERMYVESVFRDTVHQPDVIYWLTINGEGGEQSNTSTLAIDKKHNEYMKQILVKGSRGVLKTECTLLSEFIEEAVAQHQQATAK